MDDGGDGDGEGGGIIFPGHPGLIPNAPRDNISRKGIPSLRHAGREEMKTGGLEVCCRCVVSGGSNVFGHG